MKRNTTLIRQYSLQIMTVLLLAAVDQISKLTAFLLLRNGKTCTIIPGVFELRYLENRGAAFGMFRNKQWVFVLFALLIIGFAMWVYPRLGENEKNRPLRILDIFLCAGAIGNMIDRVLHGYVIDFFYFKLIDFPIFNIADIYVCISCIMFLVLIFLYYSDDDLEMIMRKNGRNEYLQKLKDAIQKESKKDE